jgi:hypothetical protein
MYSNRALQPIDRHFRRGGRHAVSVVAKLIAKLRTLPNVADDLLGREFDVVGIGSIDIDLRRIHHIDWDMFGTCDDRRRSDKDKSCLPGDARRGPKDMVNASSPHDHASDS